MGKVVRIDHGDCGIHQPGMGSVIARFTFDDGGAAFIVEGAFPSTERMIRDCNSDPFVSLILSYAKDSDTGEAKLAEKVTQWDNIWVDAQA